VTGALAAAWGALDRFAGAIGYLFAFGGLTGLGLSRLYKIIPFLNWLEVFGSKLGKGPVPRFRIWSTSAAPHRGSCSTL
jgi:hypothetical protein